MPRLSNGVRDRNERGGAPSLVRRASTYLTARGRQRWVVRVSCIVGTVMACVVCLVLMRPGISVTGDSPTASAVTASASSEKLVSQKVGATVYTDKTMDKLATDEDPAATDSIMIEGELPSGATAKAYRTDVTKRLTSAGVDTTKDKVTAYGIDLYHADGTTFEPTGSTTEKVHVAVDGVTASTDPTTVSVWYVPDDTETAPEKVDCTIDTDGKVAFEVSHFSTYAVTVSPATSTTSDTTSDTTAADDATSTQEATTEALENDVPLFGASAKPGTITTVDTTSLGVTLNLFDYDAYDSGYAGVANDSNNGLSGQYFKTGINVNGSKWRDLRFYPSGISAMNNNYTINTYTGSTPVALQGILNTTLNSSGYPTVSTTGSSLQYLFDSSAVSGKTTYSNVNHLFTKDADGYYVYNSNSNYAYYDTSRGSNGNFTVYDGTYNNNNSGGDASSDKIGFFPFNDYDSAYKNVQPNGNRDSGHYDHHFGLTMSADFAMPEGKQVNGKDMIFSFSGDDDMWVYIDGVLVLDIGGIHQPVAGNIDFTTGEVTIGGSAVSVTGKNGYGTSTTLSKVFTTAGKTWDGSEYATHTIKCFYLERGGCYSDLSLKFNMPFYVPGSFHVTKTVNSDFATDKTREFKFKVFIETSEGSDTYEQYTGSVTYDSGTTGSATGDGVYLLKSGEGFTVTNKNSKLKYYVQECDVNSGEFTTTVNGVTGTDSKPATTIGTKPTVSFVNTAVKKANLTVNKVWQNTDGTPKTDGLPAGVDVTLHKVWTTASDSGTSQHDEDVETVTLNAGNSWTHTWTSLPTQDSSGDSLSYYVSEEGVAGYSVTYTTSDGTTTVDKGHAISGDGTIQITNKEKYTLPSTGGIGKGPFVLVGTILMVGAVAGLLMVGSIRKGQRRGDVPADTS